MNFIAYVNKIDFPWDKKSYPRVFYRDKQREFYRSSHVNFIAQTYNIHPIIKKPIVNQPLVDKKAFATAHKSSYALRAIAIEKKKKRDYEDFRSCVVST